MPSLSPPVAAAPDDVVTFPDANLEAVIRDAIDKPTGDIYEGDLLLLTTLNGTGEGIIDLTGLEYCINLNYLFLSNNQISNIAPLHDLTNLQFIILDNNQISDISPLHGLTSLVSLWLRNNQISDISTLQSLTNLRELNLNTNQVSDIQPLFDNIGLGEGDIVYLRYNPLNSNSINILIPALEDRGVTVFYSSPNIVTFPDTNLEAVVRAAIGKPTGDIYEGDLMPLTMLNGEGKGIIDLTGLEYCINLNQLYLSNNQISDIQPLVDNTGLGTGDIVYLRDNPLSSNSIDILIPALVDRGVTVRYLPAGIQVVPLTLNFGKVQLGTAATLEATISNVDSFDLTVTGISLVSAGGSQFAITSAPTTPLVLPSDAETKVEVTFTPPEVGVFSDVLQITSDDPERPLIEVALCGAGVEGQLPPSEQIACILEFFESSVSDGTLVGEGGGKSAEHRLNALRNMLQAARNHIENGVMGEACQQLLAAYRKTDGQSRPPDFVTGDAALQLAGLIQNLMDTLGDSQ